MTELSNNDRGKPSPNEREVIARRLSGTLEILQSDLPTDELPLDQLTFALHEAENSLRRMRRPGNHDAEGNGASLNIPIVSFPLSPADLVSDATTYFLNRRIFQTIEDKRCLEYLTTLLKNPAQLFPELFGTDTPLKLAEIIQFTPFDTSRGSGVGPMTAVRIEKAMLAEDLPVGVRFTPEICKELGFKDLSADLSGWRRSSRYSEIRRRHGLPPHPTLIYVTKENDSLMWKPPTWWGPTNQFTR